MNSCWLLAFSYWLLAQSRVSHDLVITQILVRLSIESVTLVVGAPLCGCPGVGRPRRAAPTELPDFTQIHSNLGKDEVMPPIPGSNCQQLTANS